MAFFKLTKRCEYCGTKIKDGETCSCAVAKAVAEYEETHKQDNTEYAKEYVRSKYWASKSVG